MALLNFETLTFFEQDDLITVTLLNLFKFYINKEEFAKLGDFNLINNGIEFKNLDEQKALFRLSGLLEKYFDNLTNKLTGNQTTYIHRNSGIPLIGNVAFGIVYRDSSIIEIKPITSCNLNCVYCSISEGLSSKKRDFVMEEKYLVEELEKLIEFVDESVEIHIGVQGEPFLYADLELLVEDLNKIKNINRISIDTNATLLTKEKLEKLVNNDKLQLNFSLDAISPTLAKKIAGVNNYNVEHVKEMIDYACSLGIKVIVAPVLVDSYNNEEIEEIIKWVKTLKVQPILGIQNFLRYKTGRNPAKSISWENFYSKLAEWEKKYDIKLKLQKEDFNIKETKELPRPFLMGDIVKATIKSEDRFPNSIICAAKGRNISVPGVKFVKDKQIKVEIVRDKHNVFTGKVV